MDKVQFAFLRKLTVNNRFIPVPPADRNFVFIGDIADFLHTGFNLLQMLYERGLQPGHSILDLGCGIGRLAIPLTQYLSSAGFYFGVDINLSGIAWCHENISQKYTNFHFVVVNARNQHYGHSKEYGDVPLTSLTVPIPTSRKFHFVWASSLFTHIVWQEVEYYMRLAYKALTEGGTFISTLFLVDAAARESIQRGQALHRFQVEPSSTTYFLEGPDTYSKAIAHDEQHLLALAAHIGFVIAEPIKRGAWVQGQPGHDVLVLRRGPGIDG